MPSYQQREFLEEAVRSVLDQKSIALELIVLDPGSTDGSRELLYDLKQTYGDCLALYFGTDNGQSDAINSGLAMARGRVLGWLNSDDRLRPDVLLKVANLLDSDEPRWLYGRCGIIDHLGKPVSRHISNYKNLRGRRFSFNKLLTENFIPQMATFWNRPLMERAGGVDPKRHLDMDYDLWLRFARIVPPLILSDYLADFRVHHDAKGTKQTTEQLAAAYATAREYAIGQGIKGQLALLIHRLFSWRNRMLYRWTKP